jgi:type IV pilus assembly protein PilF
MRTYEVLLAFLVVSQSGSALAGSHDPKPVVLSRTGQINLGLAQSYLDANSLEAALDRAKRAVAADPNYGETHAVLGMVYTRIGNQAGAAQEFETALKLSPSSGSILNAHAVWLCGQGQFDRADTEFRQALADPFYTNAMQANANAGKCAQLAGRLPVAEAYLRLALEKSPEDAQILLGLAQVEFAQGQWLEARAFAQRRLSVGATAEALDLAARIEDAAGDKSAAARYRQQRSDQFPEPAPTGEGVPRP